MYIVTLFKFLFVGANGHGLSTENFVGSWGCNFICYWFVVYLLLCYMFGRGLVGGGVT